MSGGSVASGPSSAETSDAAGNAAPGANPAPTGRAPTSQAGKSRKRDNIGSQLCWRLSIGCRWRMRSPCRPVACSSPRPRSTAGPIRPALPDLVRAGQSRRSCSLLRGGTVLQTVVEMDNRFLFSCLSRTAPRSRCWQRSCDVGQVGYGMALLVDRVGDADAVSARSIDARLGRAARLVGLRRGGGWTR
jgi:hypothetical protein